MGPELGLEILQTKSQPIFVLPGMPKDDLESGTCVLISMFFGSGLYEGWLLAAVVRKQLQPLPNVFYPGPTARVQA